MFALRAVRSLLLALFLASPALVLFPVSQTMAVFVFTPRFTLTMAGTTLQHARTTGRLRLPERQMVRLSEMGPAPRAVISSEDGLFYAHRGFDTAAICAALQSNREGRPLRGASTITQQTARNLFLWQGRSWLRKGLEAGYTVLLEVFVTKNRILELYLNIAETGPMVFGIEAASQHWYRKPARDLTQDQAARIAALLPLPRRRTPESRVVRDRARWIRDHLAPMPGEPGMDALYERAAANGYVPGLCP